MLAAFRDIRVEAGVLRIPGGKALSLNPFMEKSLSGYPAPRLLILTPDGIHVTVSRHASLQHFSGMAGVDMNIDNVTMVDTTGNVIKYDLGRIPVIIENCLKAKQGLHRNDRRVRTELFRKYGLIERNRVQGVTHKITSQIVGHARRLSLGLAVENISGIQKRYRTSAGHTKTFLRKRYAWPFFEIRRQLAYKAAWYGIPLVLVSPEFTSSECSRCGGRTTVSPSDSKAVICSQCHLVLNRDENAATNIMRRGLRSGLLGSADEARADADQSAGLAS